ncbi:MAG: hypothetical protein AAB655_00375 [Patescibacteria group bacterium]
MSFAPVYLIYRLFYRLGAFFHHWYIDGTRKITHRFVSVFENADRILAIRVTLRYFFHPLYRDYTALGRILGVVFRSGRILIGLVIYGFLLVVFSVILIIWISIPPLIILYVWRK